jgi:MtrB/PioB family decaheme-associated outer membrane protein
MRLKILLMTIMTAMLFIGSAAYADDAKDFPITGTVDLGVRSVQDGTNAKFQEYRDLKSGVFGNMNFGGDNGSYYVDMTGENIGRDDQFFEVKGGRYGFYNYSLQYNEIIHNLSFDARTFYANPGSNNLTYGYTGTGSHTNKTFTPDVPSNSGTWNTFDYSIKRKNTGAAIDFSLGTPFYISMDVDHNEVTGIQPWGLRSALRSDFVGSTAGSSLELPLPVDYLTNNLNLKAGYNTKKYTFSVAGYLSKFENDNSYVTFRNPYVTSDPNPRNNTETISQAADNTYYKLSAQGSVRQLPLNSALAVQLGYSKLRNDFDIPASIATSNTTTGSNPVYSPVTLNLNKPTFAGDITYQTASLALTSQPVKAMDTKIYYNYLRKENNSDIITFQDPTAPSTIASNELFNYRKNNFGADVGYKFLPKTKATVGYEFQEVNRERMDAESTKDNSAYAEIKNSSLSWLTAKLKYRRLWRNTDFQYGGAIGDYDQYVRKYDLASKTQDTIKLGLEIDPLEHLTVGLEYSYKSNDYNDLYMGVRSDKRNEFYVDAAYEIPDFAKFTAFFDYETVKRDNLLRSNSDFPPFDPNAVSTKTTYNVDLTQEDNNYMLGLGVEVPIIKNKLNFVASWIYEKADGTTDFSTPNNWGAATFVGSDISNDYTKQSIDLKAIYKALKNLDLTFGYSYAHYEFSDPTMNGYMYVYPVSSPTSYFTGAYSDQGYNVNMFYVMASYKF